MKMIESVLIFAITLNILWIVLILGKLEFSENFFFNEFKVTNLDDFMLLVRTHNTDCLC